MLHCYMFIFFLQGIGFAVVSFAAFVACCLLLLKSQILPSCGRCRKLAYIEMIRFLEMSVPSMIVCLKTTI